MYRIIILSLLIASGAAAQPTPVTTSSQLRYTTNSFAGPTNSLALNNSYSLYSTSGDVAVTNVSNINNNAAKWQVLCVSNSSGSTITLRSTAGAFRALGSTATNALSVAAGKVGILSVQAYGNLMTNYATASQQ